MSLPSALGRGLAGAVEAVVPNGDSTRPQRLSTGTTNQHGRPADGSHQTVLATALTRRLVRVVTPACTTCVVRQDAGAGTISASVGASNKSGSRAAFAVLNLGTSVRGAVRIRDRVGLGAGQVPRGNVTVLRATDAKQRVVYELQVQGGTRLLQFRSPPGGLTAQGIDVSMGRMVPDDGVAKLDIEIETQSNNAVVVRVDNTVAFTLAASAGGQAEQPQQVAIGIVGATPGEQDLTVAHTNLSVAIQPDDGGAPVVVTAGTLPTTPPSPAPGTQQPPAPAPPTNLAQPQVTGSAVEGTQLTATPGTWQGADSVQLQWNRCAADGTRCQTIRRSSGTSYTLTTADVGSTVRAVALATNDGGTTTAVSAVTDPVASAKPVLVSPPTVSGTPMQGKTLTATPGTWTWGTGPATYAWSRCAPDASSCIPIDGAIGPTYSLVDADVSSTIQVTVTVPGVRNPSTGSATSDTVVPAPPISLSAPAIAGSAIVGRTLTADPGEWTSPTPTLTFAWLRCAADGSGCAPIAGATDATYVTSGDDAGSTIELVVTGTNVSGTVSATSAATAPILGPATNLDLPSISGAAVVGSTLTADSGSWNDPNATLALTWQRCDADGNGCTPIDGATGTTYTLADADLGSTIALSVTATNLAGTTTAQSGATAPVVLPPVPANVTPPTVSGQALVGATLTADQGTWNDGSVTLTFAWLRCAADGSGCAPIAGATDATYVTSGDDAGSTIELVVTGTNVSGTVSATSAATAPILGPATNLDLPSISGAAVVGSTLTADSGSWNDPNATLALTWQRCDADGNGCTPIDGATGTTYTLADADLGSTIALSVTATNLAGTTTAQSGATAPVVPAWKRDHHDGHGR